MASWLVSDSVQSRVLLELIPRYLETLLVLYSWTEWKISYLDLVVSLVSPEDSVLSFSSSR
jgi:hypothetical protein